jgi:hypothetical protein
MSIKLKINKNIKLDIPQFNCDSNVLGDHLNDHPLTALLNSYAFTCVIGKPGQGKTSLAIALMTQKAPKIYKKTHHKILIMMPQNSINSLKKNPFECLPIENFYNELNEETIQDVYQKLETNTALELKTLLFIDDMTADLKKSKIVETILKRIVYNRRHLKCNIIITSQSFINMPLDIRKCITNIFMFKPSKKEMEVLFDELIEAKKKSFLSIMKYAFQTNHNFLFINITSQRMFRNFDEMIMEEDEDDEDK